MNGLSTSQTSKKRKAAENESPFIATQQNNNNQNNRSCHCVLGDNDMNEQNRKEKGKEITNEKCHVKASLVCTHCQKRACSECVLKVFEKIPQIQQENDQWCQFVQSQIEILREGIEDVYIQYGHCCEFSVKKKKKEQNLALSSTISNNNDNTKKNNYNIKTNKNNKNNNKNTRDRGRKKDKVKTNLSGCLHILGANLFIDSPNNGDVDIHGFGEIGTKKNDENYVLGLMHCTPSSTTCVRAAENNIMPKPFSKLREKKGVKCKYVKVEFQLPYESSKRLQKIEIIRIPIQQPSKEEIKKKKGKNNFDMETIQQNYIFTKDDKHKDADVTIIAGYWENLENKEEAKRTEPLILYRLHNHLQKYESKYFGKELYNKLMKMGVGRSGFEMSRTGGSGGITNTATDNILEFFHQHKSSSPRPTTALKIIQTETTYDIYYIGVKDSKKKAVSHKYPPARKGGVVNLTENHFKSDSFFPDFAETKVISSIVLNALNNNSYKIAVDSVNQELENINSCIRHMGESENEKRMNFLIEFNELNSTTCVEHNVGYHFDKFGKLKPSLENKMVFENVDLFRHQINKQTNDNSSRGGGSLLNQYHFALLDWGNDNKARRSAGLELGIVNNDQRLTQTRVTNWIQSNNNGQQRWNNAIAENTN